jgi:hypothetical protein
MRDAYVALLSLAAAMGFAVRASAREQCVRESSSAQPYRCGTYGCIKRVLVALSLLVSYMTLALAPAPLRAGAGPQKSLDTQKTLLEKDTAAPTHSGSERSLHEQLRGRQSCTY